MKKFSNKSNHQFSKININIKQFIFNFANFSQIKGRGMGTKCPQTYADIFMNIFEETHIYLLIKQKVLLYLR